MRLCILQPWLWLSFCLIATVLVDAAPPKKENKKPPPEPYLKDQIPPGEAFFQDDQHYNAGAYGVYVNRTFKSSPVIAPRIYFDRPFTACDDGSYLFLTPRGEAVDPSPVILDAKGSLIWTPGPDFGQVYNFQVQHYRGQPYLTFWGGNNSVGGHGEGTYYMVGSSIHPQIIASDRSIQFDQHYRSFRNISTSNGLALDLHSFEILPGGTVLISAYQKRQVDVTGAGSKFFNGKVWIWESLFQEFDLETGEIVFEWRASDHFDYRESYARKFARKIRTDKEPWDWFHINMIDKDSQGNYLISARHLRCVAYISGKTGEVLWRLGGKANSFQDLSNGQATTFVGQHDAHWDEDHKFITLFDNRADWEVELEHVSKGTRIELDFGLNTASLNTSFVHPLRIFGFSQGSYQTLPNGNVLIGYGYTGAVAEFSPNGTLLCDAYLGPSARFSSGDVQSYRNLKFNWTGIPLTPPSAVLADDEATLYVSWHGATELRTWRLQDSHSRYGPFDPVINIPKTGFETGIWLTSDLSLREFVRVVALDKNNAELGTSDVVHIGTSAPQPHLPQQEPPGRQLSTEPDKSPTGTSPVATLAPGRDEHASDAAPKVVDVEPTDLKFMFALAVLVTLAVVVTFYAGLMPRLFARCRRRGRFTEKERPRSGNSSNKMWALWKNANSAEQATPKTSWRSSRKQEGGLLMFDSDDTDKVR